MHPLSHLTLAPFSFLYGALVRARNFSYSQGLSKTYRLNSPVISVGNITTGGTGKTPLVEYLARAAARENLKPCILTRGYGRLTPATKRVVVSDGTQLLADSAEGGDEPRLLAETLLGQAAVISDADRVSAALWAIENLGSNFFIMDDGFQHRRLERDLDLVVIDATAPWSNRHILPLGRLREPLTALQRADTVILTRTELAVNTQQIISELKNYTRAQTPILCARTETTSLQPLVNPDFNPVKYETGRQLAFCGIGNPEAFFGQLKQAGFQIVLTRKFSDHHRYTQFEIDELNTQAQKLGANALITTAKDAVKLRRMSFQLPCYTLGIEIKFNPTDQSILHSLLQRVIEKPCFS